MQRCMHRSLKTANEAIADLENKGQSSDYGRATRASAEALLAHVYMAKAYGPSKAGDDFQKAADLCAGLISNMDLNYWMISHRSMMKTTRSIQRWYGLCSTRQINYIIHLIIVQDLDGGGNNLHLFFGMQYDIQPGMQRDVFTVAHLKIAPGLLFKYHCIRGKSK